MLFAAVSTASIHCVGDSPVEGDSSTNDGGATTDVAQDVDVADEVDSALADSADGNSTCDTTKPFGTPAPVGGLKGENVWLTNDEMFAYSTQYFADAGAGPEYLLVLYTRASLAAPFGSPAPLNVSDSTQGDGRTATLTADQKVIIFASYRASPGVRLQLFTASRSSSSAPFGTVTLLANVNTSGVNEAPSLSADGTELYFDSTTDVYRSQGTAPTFGGPSKVGLGTGDATHPVISPDGLSLYFATTRGGATVDIWMAARATKTDATFGAPVAVPNVNTTSAQELPNWISPDGCRLYLTSIQGSSATMMVASRP